jgi:RNA polymerase sigma factor (sigma-70 family)
MEPRELLAEQFEANRPHLRSVAYRMLGSISEAEDAVQESWFRLSRTNTSAVANLGGWLTTVVARVCLDMLRSRKSRREDPEVVHVPDPIITRDDTADPEQQAILADSVGLALLVVLETLAPAERLAFVLHDVFAMPFDEIAPIVGRNPVAARQLASRARRRVQGSAPASDASPAEHRRLVDAFFAAARDGDFDALLEVLDPDVVVRADAGDSPATGVVRGAEAVAGRAIFGARYAQFARRAMVNGSAGVVATTGGRTFSVLGFTVRGGKIVEIDILADPERLRTIDVSALDG